MKYAIYGGTFDPLHIGHVTLADHAVCECGLDKLIFMPAYVSPFKQNKKVSPGIDRYRMIQSILGHNKAFRVSSYEITKEGPSYTYETLEHWSNMLNGELCFVLGYDSVVQLDTWYHGEDILRKYPLITARRPDTEDSEGAEKINYFRKKYGANITVLEMKPVDASSTQIRKLAGDNESISGLVLPEIEEYIIEHNLYK